VPGESLGGKLGLDSSRGISDSHPTGTNRNIKRGICVVSRFLYCAIT